MRLSHGFAPLLAVLALVTALPYEAVSHPAEGDTAPTARGEPFGSSCRTQIQGSQAVAYCHNPYPEIDHVSLHVECARWWDIDTDTRPVEAEPAMTVRLAGRCWKEIRGVWVSHGRA